jgi:hypothetical protein
MLVSTKNLFKYISPFILILGVSVSCTVKEPHPSNEIHSQDGLKIVLEWRTGSSSIQALEDADLDLFLIRGSNKVRISENIHSFEFIILEDIFADGEYIVSIESHEIFRNTEFTVYITDQTGDQVLSYTSTLDAGENFIALDFVRIYKIGTTYTVTLI